jgi:p-cumate 2,3-dioxygenase ferredoxin subunit
MSDDSGSVPLCSVDDIPEGGIALGMLPDGHPVAVYLVEGEAFATDDACTHGASSLSEDGCLSGHTVECGMHLGTFDVRTGAVTGPPCTVPLRTYPVVIRDGQVMLKEGVLSSGMNE